MFFEDPVAVTLSRWRRLCLSIRSPRRLSLKRNLPTLSPRVCQAPRAWARCALDESGEVDCRPLGLLPVKSVACLLVCHRQRARDRCGERLLVAAEAVHIALPHRIVAAP